LKREYLQIKPIFITEMSEIKAKEEKEREREREGGRERAVTSLAQL